MADRPKAVSAQPDGAPTDGAPANSGRRTSGTRLAFIVLCAVLMAAAVYVWGASWQSGQERAHLTSASISSANGGGDLLPVPAEPVQVDAGSLDYLANMTGYASVEMAPATVRTLELYYTRRAYDGAPPAVPHILGDEMSIGDKSCLQCHATGSYAPEMGAFAPIVPHPTLVACTQCHVADQPEVALFRRSLYQPALATALIDPAYDGAPAPMPHELQLRENCAACHSGPAAPPEIRTSHPERLSCQQCHVPSATDTVWVRGQSAFTPKETP